MSSRTSAYKSPSSFTKEIDYFSLNLDNISNVGTSDNTYATNSAQISSSAPYTSTYRLKGFGGFGLAPDDLITWVRVECEGYYTRVSGTPSAGFGASLVRTDSDVHATEFIAGLLLNSGGEGYVEIANSGSANDKIFNYSGMTGLTSDSSQFGILCYALRVSGTASINVFLDHVRIRIEYSLRLAPVVSAVAATANAVGLRAGRRLAVDTMSVAATANAVGLRANRLLTSATASVAATANAVSLVAHRRLSSDVAAYTLTANPVSLLFTKVLSVAPAAYTLTANAVGLTATRVLGVSTASVAVTAVATGLVAARRLGASVQTYVLSASDAGLSVATVLAVAAAAVTLTMSSVAFLASRVLPSATRAYMLTLQAVQLDTYLQEPFLPLVNAGFEVVPAAGCKVLL